MSFPERKKKSLFPALFINAMCVFPHTAISFESTVSETTTTITRSQRINGFEASVSYFAPVLSAIGAINHR